MSSTPQVSTYFQFWPASKAAAHYGAIHETLQRTITKNAKSKIDKGVVPKSAWNSIRKEMLQTLCARNLDFQSAQIFNNKINQLNELPQRLLSNRFLTELEIVLSDLEMRAWNQRNIAAHGLAFNEDDVVDIFRETKILQTLLHRIILKITHASNLYYDYYSLGYYIRGINTSIGS